MGCPFFPPFCLAGVLRAGRARKLCSTANLISFCKDDDDREEEEEIYTGRISIFHELRIRDLQQQTKKKKRKKSCRPIFFHYLLRKASWLNPPSCRERSRCFLSIRLKGTRFSLFWGWWRQGGQLNRWSDERAHRALANQDLFRMTAHASPHRHRRTLFPCC